MKKSLNEIHTIISLGKLSKSEVLTIMVNLRVFLEENSGKDDYPIIKLYCNWIVHSKINASYDAFKILEMLTDSLILHDNGSESGKWINDAIIEGLGLHKLQLELLEFNKKHPCGFEFVSDFENWKSFASILVYSLIDRPITFPEKLTNKKYKRIYNDIETKSLAIGSLVYAVVYLEFIKYEDRIYWEIKTLMTIKKGVKIVGPLSIITQEMVDIYNNI
jgi:hypothetical protein